MATACVLTLAGALLPAIPASAQAPSKPGAPDKLEVYVGTLTPPQLGELRAAGVDMEDTAISTDKSGNSAVEAVLSGRQAAKLATKGVKLSPKKVDGMAASQALRAQAAQGDGVFRPYSGPGGLKEEFVATTAKFPKIAKLTTIGKSLNGKPIIAVKVTKDAKWIEDGKRPSTLYMSAQHAREWITPEMTRRLFHHVLDGYGKDPEITKLVNTTELWFVPVSNPDGYDYTFTSEDNRLWRKNLRDNDGDGKITTLDGVDPNRNYAVKWGYDNEGSSTDLASDTFRGTGPNSEPETQAFDRFFRRIGFEFLINYHSAAELLLYGVGWQQSTPTPDDEIYKVMAGDDANPAVPGYDPDISAELYITNGDTDTHATVKYGTLGFTPEMSTCQTVSASVPDDEWVPEDCVSTFIFPDDEDLIAAEVAKNIPFALAVGKSALDPDDPVSVVGLSTPDFVVDSFDTSFGRNQPVATVVRRALKDVRMHYRINGGYTKTVGVNEWRGGERYGDTHDDYYAEVRGKVTGAKPADKVEVWFSGKKGKKATVASTHFTYTVASDIGGKVLVLAAEDVTGLSPVQAGFTSAKYADETVAAITAAGYTSDVYDFDTQGRKAPHPLGVLSHYKAVVWETGDDVIMRSPGQVPGTTAKAALDTELAVRDYLNEGGKLLATGQNALFAQAANGAYFYNPYAPPECTNPNDLVCLPLVNDFQQYYLGAHTYVSGGGTGPDGSHYPIAGTGELTGWTGTLNAAGSANNQNHTASFLPTSSFLPPAQFPQFRSEIAGDWQRPGAAPFDPLTGSWYVYSGQSDQSYKRLMRTVDLTGASSSELRFWTSYDTEAEWDFLFVEAHEVGTDNWTTLPDANGHTGTETGESCLSGWVPQLHPHLAHYQAADCSPTGTTGSWNAATGASGGWVEWAVDLSAYAGKQVELSISYASDWATQGLGVFIDDVRVTANGSPVADTSFEADLGGWTVAGPAPGSDPNSNDWTRTQTAFDEGGIVLTRDTVYTGFGIEGLAPAARDDLVARSLAHLLG
ncbi:zinc carboxypeptidase [Phytohabitans rumicis]|uniref:Zinc carboxypeptidase n=1 Tax=Phytohabitans rumicis TaxID=1076125 RepID=A0A6V8L657_9ACTN|nr:zinc carboxypeptidase [Phytohabitans rumicis]